MGGMLKVAASLVNPAAIARQAVRVTVGKSLKEKQDQAVNLANISYILELRPRTITPLSVSDIKTVARGRRIPGAVLHVIGDKESGPDGGFSDYGRLTIANEPQWFSKLTFGAYDLSHPHLSYPKWVKVSQPHKLPPEFLAEWGAHPLNMDQKARWKLWAAQAALNFDAACQCLSVGRFQVMVFHWSRMGFTSPAAMIEFANVSEANHLELCVRWFEIEDKVDALQGMNWPVIATYNGHGDIAAYEASCRKLYDKRCALYA